VAAQNRLGSHSTQCWTMTTTATTTVENTPRGDGGSSGRIYGGVEFRNV